MNLLYLPVRSTYPGGVKRETIADRIGRLAARAGMTKAELLRRAGLSRGYLGSLQSRCRNDPDTDIALHEAVALAHALSCSPEELAGKPVYTGPRDDLYEGRYWASEAARILGISYQAIETVRAEDPGHDPGREYWFHRIVSEAAGLKALESKPKQLKAPTA